MLIDKGQAMRVFLADDQASVRSALKLLLEQEPEWDVAGEAADAQELLQKASLLQPDLILLDWELPGPPMMEMLPLLRRNTPDATIIALSGRYEARPSALAAGIDAFVSKNDPPEQLLLAISQLRFA